MVRKVLQIEFLYKMYKFNIDSFLEISLELKQDQRGWTNFMLGNNYIQCKKGRDRWLTVKGVQLKSGDS